VVEGDCGFGVALAGVFDVVAGDTLAAACFACASLAAAASLA
jgi:hypothetical protein